MFVKACYAKHLPPSSLNFGLVQLGADFSLAGTFSFFFSRWLQSFEGDRITWERNRITWIGHAKDAAQTFELCVEFKLLRHRKCVHLQSIWKEHSTLSSWGDVEEGTFKLSFTIMWCKRPERRHCANFNLINLMSPTLWLNLIWLYILSDPVVYVACMFEGGDGGLDIWAFMQMMLTYAPSAKLIVTLSLEHWSCWQMIKLAINFAFCISVKWAVILWARGQGQKQICTCVSRRGVVIFLPPWVQKPAQVVDSGEERQSLQLRILAVKARFERNDRGKDVTSLFLIIATIGYPYYNPS